jgi:Dolichyl-phosphate-mannose-protein mannosyltransferase
MRSRWLVIAVVLTVLAVVVQAAFALGFGRYFPGWQPWPFLLLAAPAWVLARPVWSVWPRASAGRLAGGIEYARRIPPWSALVGVLAIAALIWAGLQNAEPYLGHEEAVYANKARSWLDGTPDSGWDPFRPIGLPVLGYLALAVHNDVGAVRVVALVLLLSTLAVTYLVAKTWTTPRQAIIVLLVVLAGLGFMRRTPQFLNDIGTTGLLLIVLYLLIIVIERNRPAFLLLAVLAAVGAFYLRYGAAGSLLAIIVAAVLAYGPRAWWTYRRMLGPALALGVVGLTPHLVHAWQLTGSPLGLVFWATEKANRTFVGDGLVYYVSTLPFRIGGDLGGVVMIAGLVAAWFAVRRLRRGEARPADRRRVFLALTCVLQVVLLGLATDGEPRFIFLSVILLTILGVQSICEYAGRHRSHVLLGIGVLALLTVPATYRAIADGWLPSSMRDRESVTAVGESLSCKAESAGKAEVLVSGYEPDLGWESGCETITYREAFENLPEGRVSFVRFQNGRLQTSEQAIRRLADGRAVSLRTLPASGALGPVQIVTVAPRSKTPPPTS